MNLAKKIFSFAWRLFRILILVAIILTVVFVITIDQMLPRQIITLAAPTLVVIGAILTFVLMKWRIKIPAKINLSDDKILNYARRHVILMLVIIAVIILGPLLVRTVLDYRDKGFLNDSREHFSVISTSTVSQARINLTQVELEKSLREIRSSVKVSLDDSIKVHLYSNVRELQEATGSPKWVYGLTRWSSQGPEIFIPAELPPDQKSILNEGAPVHELTHAIELLVTNNPKNLPLWIREGLANHYLDFWERILTHIGVWLNRDKIMSYERLSLFRYDYPQEDLERSVFYSTSYEFVRYLFMRYGESTVWGIVREVSAGTSFESAISHTTAKSERELYEDWLEQWLQDRR